MPASLAMIPHPKSSRIPPRARSQYRPSHLKIPASTHRKHRRQGQKRRLRERQASKLELDRNICRDQEVDSDDPDDHGVSIGGDFGVVDQLHTCQTVSVLTTESEVVNAASAEAPKAHTSSSTNNFIFPATPDHLADTDLRSESTEIHEDTILAQGSSAPQLLLGTQRMRIDSLCSPPSFRHDQLPHSHPAPLSPSWSYNADPLAASAFHITSEPCETADHHIPSPILYHKRSREILVQSKEDETAFSLDDNVDKHCCLRPVAEASHDVFHDRNDNLTHCEVSGDRESCFIAAALPLMGPALRTRLNQTIPALGMRSQIDLDAPTTISETPICLLFGGCSMSDTGFDCPILPGECCKLELTRDLCEFVVKDDAVLSSNVNNYDRHEHDPNPLLELPKSGVGVSQILPESFLSCFKYSDRPCRSMFNQRDPLTVTNHGSPAVRLSELMFCPSPQCLELVPIDGYTFGHHGSLTPLPDSQILKDSLCTTTAHNPPGASKMVERVLHHWSKETSLTGPSKCLTFHVHDGIFVPPTSADTLLACASGPATPRLLEETMTTGTSLSTLRLPSAMYGIDEGYCKICESVSEMNGSDAQAFISTWEDIEWESESEENEMIGLHLLGY